MMITRRANLCGLLPLLWLVSAVAADNRPASGEMAPPPDLYLSACASCHGKAMSGGFAPSLKGEAFKEKWDARGAPALKDYIAQSMPPSNAGSLPPEAYVELAGYIVNSNHISAIPTGQKHGGEAGGIASELENRDSFYLEAQNRRHVALRELTDVTENMLRRPPAQDWLSYRRTDDAHGFSPLKQINADNAANLSVAWTLTLPTGSNEITPLVHDGVIFVNSNGIVLALDAKTSETLWRFKRPIEVKQLGPPISQPRGMALYGNRLIVPTIDNHLIALDMRTGVPIWDHEVSGMHGWMRFSSSPIVVHGNVIEGATGCWGTGAGSKCFLLALSAETGEEKWRFQTIPENDKTVTASWNDASFEKRSGASIWSPPTYDPDTNLLYVGTGQTYHIASLMQPLKKRSTINAGLYTDSTLAVDADTGRLKWYFQHMARDVWDLDWSFERTLATIDVQSKPRKVVMTVGKIGILDVLDAKTGQYLFSQDLGFQNLITFINPVTGWKETDPALDPEPAHPKFLCPFAAGVRNWPATSYDASKNLLYVGASDACMEIVWSAGEDFDISYNAKPRPNGSGNVGSLWAINLNSRKIEWRQQRRASESSAALATAGGIVFEGSRDREFRASDSATGKVLWKFKLDNIPSASPISFEVDGDQCIAITTGGGNPNDAIRAFMTPEIETPPPATTLWVFKRPRNLTGEELR